MKKIMLLIPVMLLLVIAVVAAVLFIIGSPADGNALCCDVQEMENQISIYVSTPASAIAFSDVRLRQKGTALYITIREVLVSPLHNSGTHHIWIEKNDLSEIWLGGRRIWNA